MADNSQRRAGALTASIDGTAYDIVDGVTYVLSTRKRETQIGISGPQGYKETFTAGQIKMKIRDAASLSVKALTGLTSSTVSVNVANGKTVGGTGMWVTEAIEVDPIEGSFDVTFEGREVQEIKAA